ncbi:tRNA/rRNA methyltransferase [Balneatrix alpica]|uniref:tRNA/rRNA methyltransferase n=1 Tax=Balneatrix alpica TaxID=75684 RepID=A0ABV5Z8X0_9GAMM|nr:tRNA/rRNA methyltransferase [Balneatrix alpica]
MQLVFILVEPELPENVGACARALKTMGINDWRLVNPCDHLSDPARWLAHGSQDVLEKAEVFSSLEEALSDIDLVVATTVRERSDRPFTHSAQWLAQHLQERAAEPGKVAILFGRESSGLHNTELEHAQLLTYIPMAVSYPSLNLSQAVMLFAHILAPIQGEEAASVASEQGRRVLAQRLEALGPALQIESGTPLYAWLLDKLGQAREEDLPFIHALFKKLQG